MTQKVINHGTGSNYSSFVLTYNVAFSLSIITPLEPIFEYNAKVRFKVNVFREHFTSKLAVFNKLFKKI